MREDKKKKTKERGAMILLHSSFSTRRKSPPEPYRPTASVGCMSGIFRLFSNHHSLKFLTSGKKEEQGGSVLVIVDRKMISTDSHSTMMPEEEVIRSRSSSEKRMLLLGALAKCDEDLRQLKKIIEELKSGTLSAVDRNEGNDTVMDQGNVKDEFVTESRSSELPSPVSVLDEVSQSPPFRRFPVKVRSLQYGNVQQQQQKKKIQEEAFLGSLHLINLQQAVRHGDNLSGSPLWCSKAMVEAVEKACSEMAWGEKRERGRIGLVFLDQIYRDLINDLVNEVTEISKINHARHLKLDHVKGKLHGRGCRRRLSY